MVNNKPILCIDSGIGGLTYCFHFHKTNPQEPLLYIADRDNFPYGSRSKDSVQQIILKLVRSAVAQYDPKIIVLACNTASVSALNQIRAAFPSIPIVGTVPAIKPAVLASRTNTVAVLGTALTVRDSSDSACAQRYNPSAQLIGIKAPELVNFIEYDLFHATEAEKEAIVQPFIAQARDLHADSLVLGCTHFVLLKEVFVTAGKPDITVYDSVAGVSRRIAEVVDSVGRATVARRPQLLVTGTAPIEPRWHTYAALCSGDLTMYAY
ncbi:MAG: glutamate racemase [Treponema sp.]|nr:glutamate racemase [Treponema sp.]